MKLRTWQQLGLFTLLLAADQLSKWWIEQQLPFFHHSVIDGYFNIIKAHNFGVAFSMFADWNSAWRTHTLLGVTIGIALVVAIWWWRERNKRGLESWLLILILVGAIGNIWDRLQLDYVVDFIDWYVRIDGAEYHWPAFNIADACISIAVVLLLITSFKKG
ncbi:MAG: signal peptidase II [Mariprofundaceae bacterium]